MSTRPIFVNGPDGQKAKVNVPIDFTDAQIGGLDLSGLFQKSKEALMNVSDKGIDLIKGFEKFSPKPYEDYGALSIGYGTRSKHIQPDDTITEPEAEGLLHSHLNNEVIPWIKENVKTKLKQNQVDALASLVYNVGTDAFAKSRAFKALNKGDLDTFNKEAFSPSKGFTKVTLTDGVKKLLPGLVGRREKEQQLFNA